MKENKNAYLSGRISGDSSYKKKFAYYQKKLEKHGYDVFNPALQPEGLTYDQYMERDLEILDGADVVFFMPDWILSNGCNIEWETAYRHDKEKVYLKPAKIWKIIANFISFYAAMKMKHISGNVEYHEQLKKFYEEQKELDECDLKNQCKLKTKTMLKTIFLIDPDFPIFYTSFVKNTPQEECADCFITISGLRNVTDRDDKRKQIKRHLMDLTEFCFSLECVLHILLKLKYNQVREDWKDGTK